LYRGNIWAALLEVDGDIDGSYAAVDKETPTHTDRQVIALRLTFSSPQDHYRSRKKQAGENYIIRASIICAPHLILLGWVGYVG
jgi:hypothetical protein